MSELLSLGTWVPILDGDPIAAQIYDQHYASERSRDRRRARGTLLILGPGQKLLLSTPCRRALFAWRKFIDDSGQRGVNCAVFANMGAGRSSRCMWKSTETWPASVWPDHNKRPTTMRMRPDDGDRCQRFIKREGVR